MCGVIALACRDADDPSTARSFRELAELFPTLGAKASQVDAQPAFSDGKAKKKDRVAVGAAEVGRHFVKLQQLRTKANKGVRILAAQDLLQRFCARLHVDIDGERAATAVLDALAKYGRTRGQRQASEAAAAILYATKHLTAAVNVPTAKEIALVTKVSEATILSSYQELVGSKTGAVLNRVFAEELAEAKTARDRARRPC